uniref:Uncharacterized protein n=1 Tax=Rhizophora mucronata TaxID=61149 RepID=A0A2P2IXH5_RHIMU
MMYFFGEQRWVAPAAALETLIDMPHCRAENLTWKGRRKGLQYKLLMNPSAASTGSFLQERATVCETLRAMGSNEEKST